MKLVFLLLVAIGCAAAAPEPAPEPLFGLGLKYYLKRAKVQYFVDKGNFLFGGGGGGGHSQPRSYSSHHYHKRSAEPSPLFGLGLYLLRAKAQYVRDKKNFIFGGGRSSGGYSSRRSHGHGGYSSRRSYYGR